MLRSKTDSLRPKLLSFETLETRALLTITMTAQEQLFIELVNQARADPEAEVLRNAAVQDLNQEVEDDEQISSNPKQPLAPHQALTDAMVGHVNDMLRQDFFAHENPNGGSPTTRAIAAGYPTGAGENIAWSGNTRSINQNNEVYLRHAGLFESVGHRVNMMRESWREVGAGIRYGSFTNEGVNYQASVMAGTLFGNRGGNVFITGVAITDRISPNNFYEIGEGMGNVLITVVNAATSEVYSDRTGGSGGFSIQVPTGIYTVTATGGLLTRPLTVRGVRVDGMNVKVDFNSRLMDTRYIQGRFFEDSNSNNRRDAGEAVLGGRTAYIDLNNNDQIDVGEPSQVADATGLYRIDGLLPNEYIVRQVIPDGWEQSTEGTFIVDTSDRNVVGVDFAVREIDIKPTANNDQVTGKAGQDITINVLDNDSDPDGSIDADSIRITSSPQSGQASVIGQNIVYKSIAGFSGQDSITYTIEDQAGQRSNVATVFIEISNGNAWQNPAKPEDVDGDGFIIPRDVLALVTEINSRGAHALHDRVRQTNSPYFDVSGDGFLSPIDVLHVVAYLNGQSASGEPPEPRSDVIDQLFAVIAQKKVEEERFADFFSD